jgi:peptide deformylase
VSVKNIVTNEEKLKLVSLNVESFNDVSDIASDLVDTAIHYSKKSIGCVGLACNQIGVLKRIIVIRFAGEWLVMVNPIIDEVFAGRFLGRESCLSRPGKSVKVRRYKKIKVTYINICGETFTIKFTKFTARVIQHEIDHLDGKYI